MPTPPTPVSVTSRWARTSSASSFTSTSRPTKLVDLHRQVPRHRVQRPQRRELDPRPVGAHLEQMLATGQVAQAVLAQIDQLDARHHRRRRRRHQDLAAVTGGHHPRRPVQHRPEVVAAALSASPVAIPMRTGSANARCASTAASIAARAEPNAAHTPSPVCLNNQPPCASIAERSTSSWTASADAHRLGVGLPATRRTLDIGEQKRHRPRRPSRCRRHCIAGARAQPPRSACPVELRGLGEDGSLEVADAGAWFDAQVFAEQAAESLVGAQRIRLPPGSIEGQHQLRPQLLAVGVLGDQPLELAAQRGVAAEGEVGFDAILGGRQPELVELGRRRTQRLRVGERPKGRSAPQSSAAASRSLAVTGSPVARAARPSAIRRWLRHASSPSWSTRNR